MENSSANVNYNSTLLMNADENMLFNSNPELSIINQQMQTTSPESKLLFDSNIKTLKHVVVMMTPLHPLNCKSHTLWENVGCQCGHLKGTLLGLLIKMSWSHNCNLTKHVIKYDQHNIWWEACTMYNLKTDCMYRKQRHLLHPPRVHKWVRNS